MHRHYTYLGELISSVDLEKLVTGLIVGALLVAVGAVVFRKLKSPGGVQSLLVPQERVTLVGMVDFILEAFVKYQDSIMGPEGRKYVSFTGTIFFFLLTANLIGLVPGVAAATTTVWVTVGMAIVVFIYFNYLGVKQHGVLGYLKHFCGPVWQIAIILFPVEIISACIRVLTLNLRLYWNITSDHLVLATFTGLAPSTFGVSLAGLPFYVLGTFVALVQALIFTTLTMVYISLAVQHEEEH
jgi:F-type H+-transporting ATPase subunit a